MGKAVPFASGMLASAGGKGPFRQPRAPEVQVVKELSLRCTAFRPPRSSTKAAADNEHALLFDACAAED